MAYARTRAVSRFSPTELALMAFLATGQVVTTKGLVWAFYSSRPDGGPLTANNVVYVTLANVRRELAKDGITIPHLARTVGVRLLEPDLTKLRKILARAPTPENKATAVAMLRGALQQLEETHA